MTQEQQLEMTRRIQELQFQLNLLLEENEKLQDEIKKLKGMK